jgi:hypothetical protein
MAAPLRNILGQVRSRFDPRFMMDTGRIFIANLSKGKLGEDKANLLGSLLVTQFQLAAMERASIAEEERKDFHLYIDEFHNFSTESFCVNSLRGSQVSALPHALASIHRTTAARNSRCVFGNVGSLISFRVGNTDGEILAKEFDSGYTSDQFTDLANHEIRVKLLQAGESSEPFLAKTLPPVGAVRDAEKISFAGRGRSMGRSERSWRRKSKGG